MRWRASTSYGPTSSGGTVTKLGGYYWIAGTLERFSGFPFAACIAISVLLCAYEGLGLVARKHQRVLPVLSTFCFANRAGGQKCDTALVCPGSPFPSLNVARGSRCST